MTFYYDSRGSLGEVQSQLIDAKDLQFISEIEFQKVQTQSEKVAGLLGGLIKSTNNLAKR